MKNILKIKATEAFSKVQSWDFSTQTNLAIRCHDRFVLDYLTRSIKEKHASKKYDFTKMSPNDFLQVCSSNQLFESNDFNTYFNVQNQNKLSEYLKHVPLFSGINVFFIKDSKTLVGLKKELSRLDVHLIEIITATHRESPEMIKEIAKKHEFRLDHSAIRFLIDHIGHDYIKIENEIFKQRLLDPDSKVLTSDQLSRSIDQIKDEEAFKLVDLLLANQNLNAQLYLKKLLDNGQSSLAIIGIIANFIRVQLYIKENMMDKLRRYPSFVLNKYRAAANKNSSRKILDVLGHCGDVERQLKSSKTNDFLLLSGIINQYHGA